QPDVLPADGVRHPGGGQQITLVGRVDEHAAGEAAARTVVGGGDPAVGDLRRLQPRIKDHVDTGLVQPALEDQLGDLRFGAGVTADRDPVVIGDRLPESGRVSAERLRVADV